MIVYKGRLIKNLLIENRSSSCQVTMSTAFKPRTLFATDLAANFGCNRFRIMPEIVSKLLCATIWSRCAVQVESEQTPIPRAGRRVRSAALHRIRLRKCCFVPCHICTQRPITDRNMTDRKISHQSLLLCTKFDSEHAALFLVIFLLRDQWLIERSVSRTESVLQEW